MGDRVEIVRVEGEDHTTAHSFPLIAVQLSKDRIS